MSTHDDLADLLGAYALDAVDPDEAELLDRHLEHCPRCRAELREHRETAALLGYMGGAAPVGLWDQIVAEAQEPPPALQLRSSPAPVSSLARRQRSLRVRTVVAAAGIAAALIAALGFQVSRLDHRTTVLNQAMDNLAPTPTMSTVREALAEPGSRVVHLSSMSSRAGSVDAVVTPSGVGYLYDAKMEPLPSDRTYQLWGVVGDQTISYGLMGSDPSNVSTFRSGPDVEALAVTDEVAGGVEHSTQPLVVLGQLSAPRTALAPPIKHS